MVFRVLACLLVLALPAAAQPRPPLGTIPTADAAGLRDSPALPRCAGSVLLGGSTVAFDVVSFANAPLSR